MENVLPPCSFTKKNSTVSYSIPVRTKAAAGDRALEMPRCHTGEAPVGVAMSLGGAGGFLFWWVGLVLCCPWSPGAGTFCCKGVLQSFAGLLCGWDCGCPQDG